MKASYPSLHNHFYPSILHSSSRVVSRRVVGRGLYSGDFGAKIRGPGGPLGGPLGGSKIGPFAQERPKMGFPPCRFRWGNPGPPGNAKMAIFGDFGKNRDFRQKIGFRGEPRGIAIPDRPPQSVLWLSGSPRCPRAAGDRPCRPQEGLSGPSAPRCLVPVYSQNGVLG